MNDNVNQPLSCALKRSTTYPPLVQLLHPLLQLDVPHVGIRQPDHHHCPREVVRKVDALRQLAADHAEDDGASVTHGLSGRYHQTRGVILHKQQPSKCAPRGIELMLPARRSGPRASPGPWRGAARGTRRCAIAALPVVPKFQASRAPHPCTNTRRRSTRRHAAPSCGFAAAQRQADPTVCCRFGCSVGSRTLCRLGRCRSRMQAHSTVRTATKAAQRDNNPCRTSRTSTVQWL